MVTRDDDAAPADQQLVVLARAIERNRRRVDGLDTHVRQLAADLLTLTALLGGPRHDPAGAVGEADEGPPAVRSWLLADDPDQAVDDLADLIGWLDRIYLRYHGAFLSSCWLWHADVVEELWWLRRAHADAYDPERGSWPRVGEWHDRQRPAVVKRVKDTIVSCELALHAPGQRYGHRPPGTPLVAAAVSAAHAWTTDPTGPGPVPTTAQLDEAEAITRDQHRHHY